MLLKIYTDQGSLRVIENIEEIEVHQETHYINPNQEWPEGHKPPSDSMSGANIAQGGVYPTPQCYGNFKGEIPCVDLQTHGFHAWPIRFIDYRKTGEIWKRIAIGFRGTTYLCNDHGKTIERILEPGRQAA